MHKWREIVEIGEPSPMQSSVELGSMEAVGPHPWVGFSVWRVEKGKGKVQWETGEGIIRKCRLMPQWQRICEKAELALDVDKNNWEAEP